MTKQSTIELLEKQLPGFYSVEQVIKLINDIEENTSDSFEITDEMVMTLDSEGTDLIDDYDLSMNYKEVELDSISLNEGRIRAAVKDAIEEYIDYNKADA